MPTAEKAMKERDRTQMPVAKKERKKEQTTNACGKERKTKLVANEKRLDTRNPCTRYNPLSSDNNTAGQQTLTNYPTQRKNERSR